MKLSIKYKVPLFFSATILTTAIMSVFIVAVISDYKMSGIHKDLVRKFAYENSNEVLSRNKKTLDYKMMLLGKENIHLKAFFLIDNKAKLVSKYDPDNIVDPNKYSIISDQNFAEEVGFMNDKGKYLSIMRLETNGMLIGILGGVFDKPGVLALIFEIDENVKHFLIIFLIVGLALVFFISVLLSRQIVTPILELSRFINENNTLSPEFMKNIKIKKKKCWLYKKCNDKECKCYKDNSINCWDNYLENKKSDDANPMLAPCFDCKVFLSREDDEIDRLKIFLNHLISKMRYHYKQSKQYSLSLEDKVNRRTAELREITDDLIAANLKTQMIIENVAEGIVVLDKNNIIIQFNQEAKDELFIKADKNIFGSKLEDVCRDTEAAKEINKLAIKTISLQKGIEAELLYKIEEKQSHLFVRTTIVNNHHLGETFVILLIRDNTNAKIVENFKNDFFHMISHDLRNPLTSVIGFIDLLLNGSINDKLHVKQRKYLEFASKSAADLKKMLDDLSIIIKMQQRKIDLNIETFYLNDLFIEVQQAFYPLFVQNSTDFKFKVTPNDLTIHADYQRIKQVFANLIANSIKSGERITIKLEAVKLSSNIIIVIEDNGVGIPPEKLPLLFERFTQLYTYQQSDAGMGLGLSIVKNIINLHNGHISVDSQLNKGTKFTITLSDND